MVIIKSSCVQPTQTIPATDEVLQPQPLATISGGASQFGKQNQRLTTEITRGDAHDTSQRLRPPFMARPGGMGGGARPYKEQQGS